MKISITKQVNCLSIFNKPPIHLFDIRVHHSLSYINHLDTFRYLQMLVSKYCKSASFNPTDSLCNTGQGLGHKEPTKYISLF